MWEPWCNHTKSKWKFTSKGVVYYYTNRAIEIEINSPSYVTKKWVHLIDTGIIGSTCVEFLLLLKKLIKLVWRIASQCNSVRLFQQIVNLMLFRLVLYLQVRYKRTMKTFRNFFFNMKINFIFTLKKEQRKEKTSRKQNQHCNFRGNFFWWFKCVFLKTNNCVDCHFTANCMQTDVLIKNLPLVQAKFSFRILTICDNMHIGNVGGLVRL